ncbi:MAG: DUF6502 family protein [Pseudomonadota bacterium]|nr:DUF6502 family protein [Pseudomonadota bacterium]
MEAHSTVITRALVRILTPLVRILLRHGVSCGAFEEILRRVYVDVADREFGMQGRKQSVSRISVITGLNRKEVKRLRDLPPIEESRLDERYNRAARVISGWLEDPAFQDRKGDPDCLPLEGERSFSTLVKQFSGDMPPRAVADELLRVGAMETTPHSEYRLTARGYVPGGGVAEKLQVLGTDTSDLIETIDHNLSSSSDVARFQRKVMYDNVPVEHVPGFRKLSARLGQNVLEQLNTWLSERDRDSNPKAMGNGHARVGLGIYAIEEIRKPDDTGNPDPEIKDTRS